MSEWVETRDSDTLIRLPYGQGQMEARVPTANLLAVASPAVVLPHRDADTIVRDALRNPVGSAPFRERIRPGQKLLVLVDDLTRPTPVEFILPILFEELEVEERGIEVTILIALGTHRKMTPAEIERKVGKEIAARYTVLNHEWEDENALVDLGATANGTPIRVNRLVMQADLCLGISNIVPHNLAGWSGGAKIVQPGVCGKETTYRTHLLAARCPNLNFGRLDNPVRAEIEQVVTKVPLHGSINTVLGHHTEIIGITAGEPHASHRQAVALAEKIWQVPVPGLADIVIASSYPADIDFWQANKGLFAAEHVVKRGGDIILVTPCPERLSSQAEHVETLEALQGIPSRELYHCAVARGIEDFAALCVSDIAARCNELGWVTVISDGLTDHDLAVLGFARAANVEQALGRALERQGPNATIVVITHGGETSPVIQTGLASVEM